MRTSNLPHYTDNIILNNFKLINYLNMQAFEKVKHFIVYMCLYKSNAYVKIFISDALPCFMMYKIFLLMCVNTE